MAQLRYGARQALDNLRSELDYIKEYAYNPQAILALVEKCETIIKHEIEPRLQRAEPTIETRLNEMAAQHQQDINELRQQIALIAAMKD